MRAMPVEVILKLEQLVFEICGRPEQCAVQKLASYGTDQPFHKWMRQGNVRHRLNFDHLQDSQIGSPSLKEKKRIVIAAEVLRHDWAAPDGTIEHPAESPTVDWSGMHCKPNDPARELIHDDQDPVSAQGWRLAAKQIQAPETVFRLTQESQPGRTAGVRFWSVMFGQNASDNVFVNWNAEGQGKLLSDSGTTPGGIALFHVDNGVDDFSGRPLWPGPALAFLREQHAVLSPYQGVVEVQ